MQPNMNEKKILIIGPNIPRKCGVAANNFQMATTLKNEGWIVDILSPFDCEGTYHENLIGGFNLLKLCKYAKKYKKINLHFTPEEYFYVGKNPLRFFNIIPLFSFCIIFKLIRNINIIIHEPPLTKFFFERTFLHKKIWSSVPQITFFTNSQRIIFEEKLHITLRSEQYIIEKENMKFQRFSNLSKIEARNKLNIQHRNTIFVCNGFINANKGFDRIAKVFSEGNFQNCELYIVGDIRLEADTSTINYFSKLSEISMSVNNIHLIKKYLSFEDFDNWIIASDYIVLPYHISSNSGVLSRAKLYNKSVIVSNIGGLKDLLDDKDFCFTNDDELQNIVGQININNVVE